MRVVIAKRAEKQIEKLPQLVKLAVAKKVRELASGSDNLQIKKLSGYDKVYRIRVGHFRIVYYYSDNAAEILAVQHRKDVYRGEFL